MSNRLCLSLCLCLSFCIFLKICWCYPSKIPIISFTMPDDREQGVTATLNYTVNRLNSAIQNVFLLAHKNKALRTANGDTWGVMNKVCHEMKSGFMVMLTGESEQRPHEAYFSVSNSLEIPLVNWDSSPLLPAQIQSNSFEISLKPPNHQIIADLIVLKKWDNFIYLHDVENSDKDSKSIHICKQSLTSQFPQKSCNYPKMWPILGISAIV
uniref:Receptor ligand binding region domain-containing protein n=1 Tax=Ditylenchus dipsaci TaxID=166011 RepID=A0A915DX95_9BILA